MSTGFLVTFLTGKLSKVKDVIPLNVIKKLYIYISAPKNIHSRNNPSISKMIVEMYTSSASLFPNVDVRIILNELKVKEKITKMKDYKIDVLIMPKNYNEEPFASYKHSVKSIYYVDESNEFALEVEEGIMYNNVVLGGTFDRLHIAHKILLTEALMRCSRKLTVGITDAGMLKGKQLWEIIEPCQKRIQNVEAFVREVDASILCEIVPITDMYGPTKSDPGLEMIVVSQETAGGALKVNELRANHGLNILAVHVIDLIEETSPEMQEEPKVGSSNIRKRLLGTYLKIPQKKPLNSLQPYLIGLTGGIASGKSTISSYLAELGAGIIDCDLIGHKLYEPGTEIYRILVKVFGETILKDDGTIDRKHLGAIVFNDYEKLQRLNSIMWPSIWAEATNESKRLFITEQKNIIVLEAAVLLRAGWHKYVNEVWTAIIPVQEAIARLQKRNSLSLNEAKLRVESQPSNVELIEIAHVVFCSLWSEDFTKMQVNKAWAALNERLSQ